MSGGRSPRRTPKLRTAWAGAQAQQGARSAGIVPLNGLATDGEPRTCKREHGQRSAASPRSPQAQGPVPWANLLSQAPSEGTRGVCGRRPGGAFLWVRKERTPSYGSGCAGESQASGGRLARRTGRPRRVCPGLPSAAGKPSAGRRAQDLQARARRAKRRKPVSAQSPSGDTFMKSTQTP